MELGTNYGNVTEVSVEECQKILTVSDLNGWVHEQALNKYKKEISEMKKRGLDYQQVIDFIVQHKRPLKELAQTIIEEYAGEE